MLVTDKKVSMSTVQYQQLQYGCDLLANGVMHVAGHGACHESTLTTASGWPRPNALSAMAACFVTTYWLLEN